ncbi:hypothetical protein MHBO_000474 [Bonamia ostreae]|uniref:Kringle domain-containing protein n=1 Tax=Bonamia ostreae TaxID=126728 RepID=A0ABV2AGC7_9EUKA
MQIIILILWLSLLSSSAAKKTTSDKAEKCHSIGIDYRGKLNKSISGKPCKVWPSFYIYTFPGSGVGPHSFCRNPLGKMDGPFCITKLGLKGKMDETERCNVTCAPGMIQRKLDHVCETVVKEFDVGTLQKCVESCMKSKDCTDLSFKTGGSCYQCAKKDRGRKRSGYDMFAHFDMSKLNHCKVSKSVRRNRLLDSSECTDGAASEDCVIMCRAGYVGDVSVKCKKEGTEFEIKSDCEMGCYLEAADAKPMMDLRNCQSSNRKLVSKKDCVISCLSKLGEVEVKCKRAGAAFEVTERCKVPKCKINFVRDKAELKKIDLGDCDTKKSGPILLEQCNPLCKEKFKGTVVPNCNPNGFFDLNVHCFEEEKEEKSKKIKKKKK